MIQEFQNKSTGQWEKFALDKSGKKWVPIQADITAAPTGAGEAFMVGAGKKVDDLLRGVGIGGDRPQADQAAYGQLKAEQPWAVGAGEVASELGQMVAPGMGASKVLKYGARYAPKLAAAAPVAADFIGSGTMAGLRAPDEGNTRLGNVGAEAVGSVLGEAGGRVLKKAMKGINKVPGAQELLDEGIMLSPRMAGKTSFGAGAQSVIENTVPTAVKAYDKVENLARKDWHMIPVKAAALPGTDLTGLHGRPAVAAVGQGFKKAYDDIWQTATVSPTDVKVTLANLKLLGQTAVRQDDKAVINKLRKSILLKRRALKKAGDPRLEPMFNNEMDMELATAALAAKGKNRDYLSLGLDDIINDWRGSLPQPVKEELAVVDEMFPGYLAISRAARSASDDIGQFTPNDLQNAVKHTVGPKRWERGEFDLQKIAEGGLRTTARRPEVGTTFWKAGMRAFPGAPKSLINTLINRPMLGESLFQKGARNLGLDEILGRKTGAALTDENEIQRKLRELRR